MVLLLLRLLLCIPKHVRARRYGYVVVAVGVDLLLVRACKSLRLRLLVAGDYLLIYIVSAIDVYGSLMVGSCVVELSQLHAGADVLVVFCCRVCQFKYISGICDNVCDLEKSAQLFLSIGTNHKHVQKGQVVAVCQ